MALLYTGRGTSQLCLAETKKVLADLEITTTLLSQIGDLEAWPAAGSSILGKVFFINSAFLHSGCVGNLDLDLHKNHFGGS